MKRILEKFFPPSRRGRKGYDKILMFLWLMYKQVMQCSYRDLESITGIDYSTFIKFRQRLKEKQWFPHVFRRLVRFLVSHMKRIHALLDSSFVETYSGHEERGSAYSGYKKKVGFKLHQIIKRKERSRDRSLYKKRTGIERYFSRKKGVFRLGEERTRHLENFRTNCYMTSIMEILEWLAKHPGVGV